MKPIQAVQFKQTEVTSTKVVLVNQKPDISLSSILAEFATPGMYLGFQVQLLKVSGNQLVEDQWFYTPSIKTVNRHVTIDLFGQQYVGQIVIYNNDPNRPRNFKDKFEAILWAKSIKSITGYSSNYYVSNQDYVSIQDQLKQRSEQIITDHITVQDYLREARKISLVGDVIGSQYFNGSGDIQIPTTITVELGGQSTQHTHTSDDITDQKIQSKPNTIVKRDQNSDIFQHIVHQQLDGNQQTQTKFASPMTLKLGGQVIGQQQFDGSGEVTITTTLAQNYQLANHTHSEYSQVGHTHTEYQPLTHSHSEYSLTNHTHSGYQTTSHTHSEYSLVGHTHSYQPLVHSHSEYSPTGHVHTEYQPLVHDHGNYQQVGHSHIGNDITDQTSEQQADKIVKRDANGSFSAGTISQNLNGNQQTQSKLQTPVEIAIAGQVNGSQQFDGSGSINIVVTGDGGSSGIPNPLLVDEIGIDTSDVYHASLQLNDWLKISDGIQEYIIGTVKNGLYLYDSYDDSYTLYNTLYIGANRPYYNGDLVNDPVDSIQVYIPLYVSSIFAVSDSVLIDNYTLRSDVVSQFNASVSFCNTQSPGFLSQSGPLIVSQKVNWTLQAMLNEVFFSLKRIFFWDVPIKVGCPSDF